MINTDYEHRCKKYLLIVSKSNSAIFKKDNTTGPSGINHRNVKLVQHLTTGKWILSYHRS